MPVENDYGALRGGAPRVVWFTGDGDPRLLSARSVAHDLARARRPGHLVWNPLSGEMLQLLPLTQAALLLDDQVRLEGRVCAQIMVVGNAHEPFTSGPLKNLDVILTWLDGWGVNRRWPAGPPLPTPQAYHSVRDRRPWARGGHFGASQVPGVTRVDPGAIDIRRITGRETPVADIPRPRPAPDESIRVPRPVALGVR